MPKYWKTTKFVPIFSQGPGCSSFAGALFENYPVTTPHFPAGYPKTKADEPLISNEWAWTKATNMLFVEQPAGTGFSYGELPETETNLSIQFYNFLVNFYDTFDMYPKRLFIFGESYAGMYVPSIARQIYTENKKEDTKKMNLKGIGIGNGWMDAKVQGPMVIDYAWWHGMVSSPIQQSNKLHATAANDFCVCILDRFQRSKCTAWRLGRL